MSGYEAEELATFLAGIVSTLGEVRVPVSTFDDIQNGVYVIYDEENDEIVFTLEAEQDGD